MTNKRLTAGLASIAAMAGLLTSMPAETGAPGAAWVPPPPGPVHQAHNRWPGRMRSTAPCPTDHNGPDGDRDCDDVTGSSEDPDTDCDTHSCGSDKPYGHCGVVESDQPVLDR